MQSCCFSKLEWYPDERKYREMHHLKFDVLLRETPETRKGCRRDGKRNLKGETHITSSFIFSFTTLCLKMFHILKELPSINLRKRFNKSQ